MQVASALLMQLKQIRVKHQPTLVLDKLPTGSGRAGTLPPGFAMRTGRHLMVSLGVPWYRIGISRQRHLRSHWDMSLETGSIATRSGVLIVSR